MGIFTQAKIDRDFTGGIYLPPLGEIPSLDQIETVEYRGPLLLPLYLGSASPMQMVLESGQRISRNRTIARGASGQCLFAPRAGILGPQTTAWIGHQPHQPVITLLPLSQLDRIDEPQNNEPLKTNPFNSLAAAHSQLQRKQKVLEVILEAGLLDPSQGRLFAEILRNLESHPVTTVIANATPLEYEINTPLAILRHFPEQVFAGLAILKTWLGADQAVMAYPNYFPIDKSIARQWQVRCVPVSEKYPQGTSHSVFGTLKKQGVLKRRQKNTSAVVFSIQLLRQIERAVLAGRKPTERIITICGDGVAKPSHFLAPLGMPLMELLHAAQIHDHARCVALKSSLTGDPIDPENAVISSLSESFIVLQQVVHPQPQRCLRCGRCIEYCPAQIDPARLLQLAEAGRFPLAVQMGAHSCIECGICSYLCPSHLRIMEHIRMIKIHAHSTRQAPPEQEENA